MAGMAEPVCQLWVFEPRGFTSQTYYFSDKTISYIT